MRRRLALIRGSSFALGLLLCLTACFPVGPFDPEEQPPAPSYALRENWMCLPDRDDFCDQTPALSLLADRQSEAEVDCFAVSPTTYYVGTTWNADVNDELMRAIGDRFAAQWMFSAFNGTCRIYAPAYRESHIICLALGGEFYAGPLGVAYADVHSAFDYYLEHLNEGRPFFLASHSQGARTVERLLKERIEGSELADRMVAAYVIGGQLQVGTFETLPYCRRAGDTGCVVGWRTVAEDYVSGGLTEPLDDRHCTNPLSWSIQGGPVPAFFNPGSVDMLFLRVEPGLAGARCREDGLLAIDSVPPPTYPQLSKDYHIADIGLFYIALRKNAKKRWEAYRAAHEP